MRFITKDTLRIVNGLFILTTSASRGIFSKFVGIVI